MTWHGPKPLALAAALLAANAGAQVAPGHAVIASRVAGGTQLLDLDLGSGAHVALASFPGSGLAPLALEIDPVSRDVFVFLDAGSARTRCVRLRYSGRALSRASVVSESPGLVRSVVAAGGADLFLADAAGLSRLRRWGAPSPVAALPGARSLSSYDPQSSQAWVVRDASSTTAASATLLDLTNGQSLSGPHAYPNFTAQITGFVDMPTALVRQLLTDSLGRVSLSVNFQAPVPLALTPVLPAGATRALRFDMSQLDAYVLGGSAHPYLKSVRGWVPQAWNVRGGPFPGDPVAFDLVLPTDSDVTSFGAGCDAQGAAHPFAIRTGSGGAPRIGNANFALLATQAPAANAPLLFVLGADEIQHVALPAPCLLRIAPDFVFAHTSDRAGGATQALPIPNDARLLGAVFYGQWVQVAPGAQPRFATSNAAACHVR